MTVSSEPSAARHRLWHGSGAPADARRELVAGPLHALLVGPDVRYVRFGRVELVQRIYVAVRDTAWNTVPGRLADLEVVERSDGFVVRFRQRHTYGDVDFEWSGTMTGSADGVLTYEMDGVPLRSFAHNKIGLNIHHPLSEYLRRPYRAITPEGPISGTIGWEIAPQLVSGGTLTAMFPFFDQLEVDLASGGTARFEFEGDYFEMQDHRNWSDGNLKTYGTPLSRGYPLDVAEGTRIHQKVTVRYTGQAARVDVAAPIRIEIGATQRDRLPAIGLGMASHDGALSEREVRLLAALRPDHLRADLHPRHEGYHAAWERAVRAAKALGCPLELAVFVTSQAAQEAAALAELIISSGVQVARVLVFEEAEGFSELRGATAPDTARLVRDVLRSGGVTAPVAGGTNQFFNELNRTRPETSGTDGIAYSLNPQVHAADDLSLADNLLSLPDIASFTRVICGDVPVFVTPVTLIGRTGPFPGGPPEEGGLPGAVDVRQALLLGAGWTAASLRGLAEGGADAITYYETTGWRGVIETETGAPMPDRFPSQPGDAFPVYHVLADVADWKGAEMLRTASDAPNVVAALAVRDSRETHAIVVNLTPDLRRTAIGPLPGSEVRLRVLDDTTAPRATRSPEAFRIGPPTVQPLEDGWLHLTLAPHAIVRVDTVPGAGVADPDSGH